MPQDELATTLSHSVIGAATEVHRHLGPGLLEAVYRECLCVELERLNLPFERHVLIPVTYKGHPLRVRHRVDLMVSRYLVVDVLAIDAVMPVHEARLLTQLRVTGLPLGLLINFNVQVLREGMRRVVHGPRLDPNAFDP